MMRTAGNNADSHRSGPPTPRTSRTFRTTTGTTCSTSVTRSASAPLSVPGNGMLTGGWSLGGIASARSGLPIEVLIARNDVVYVDGAGNAFLNPAADRTAVVNTPGGGASRSTVVLIWCRASARKSLTEGCYSSIRRRSQRRSLERMGISSATRSTDRTSGRSTRWLPNEWAPHGASGELRLEVFNLFDHANFAGIGATLPNALPSALLTEANKVQPGQAFTAGAAGAFGRATSTVGTTVGIGTNRQVQLAFRLNF